MRPFFWLCCWLLPTWSLGQSVVLLPPLNTWSSTHTPLLHYMEDTAYFSASMAWQGLVYADFPADAPDSNLVLELIFENAQAQQEVVSVQLTPASGQSLHQWHPSLQKTLPMTRESAQWYRFDLIPLGDLITAYDVVGLGRALKPSLEQSGWQVLKYRPLGSERNQHLRVQLQAQAPHWASFWTQYEHFESLAQQLEAVRRQQETLRRNCQPAAFEQVLTWAEQQDQVRDKKTDADVQLMAAVEQLKIITETLPESTPSYLKRDLHALLRLDVALLEQPTPVEQERLLQRKADLLRQLSLYPSLKGALQAYTRASGSTARQERQQAMQTQALERVNQQLAPYRSLYQRYQMLQAQADYLHQQLRQPLNP